MRWCQNWCQTKFDRFNLFQKVRKTPDFLLKSGVFMARSTEKDITGFFEKSACDKAFSDFFYIFSCSM